jgi:hypothetical protein
VDAVAEDRHARDAQALSIIASHGVLIFGSLGSRSRERYRTRRGFTFRPITVPVGGYPMLKTALVLALASVVGLAVAEEAAPAAAAVDIAAYDSDKDGALSAVEIAAIVDEKAKADVVALDADKSGDVSAVEAKAAAKPADAK